MIKQMSGIPVTGDGGRVSTSEPARGRAAPVRRRSRGSTARRFLSEERGAATAEYAITIIAAVGFAGLLVAIMRSDEVRGFLVDIVRGALQVGG